MNEAVIVGLIAAIPATVAALLDFRNKRGINRIEVRLNGQLDRLLKALEEKKEKRQR